MYVKKIPIPAIATIYVSKNDQSASFDTTVIQTSDNKYIYVMPVRKDKKIVNFDIPGLSKEIRVHFDSNTTFVWKNVTISKFVDGNNVFLRIRTKTNGSRYIPPSDHLRLTSGLPVS